MSTADEEAWPEGKLLRRSDPASRQCSASSLLLPSIASPVSGPLGSHLCTLGAVVGGEMTCCRAWLGMLGCNRQALPAAPNLYGKAKGIWEQRGLGAAGAAKCVSCMR